MSRQWWKFHSERTRIKSHLRRLKNVGMVTEKLYRNTLNTLWFRDCIPDIIAPCKGIRIPESGKFLLVEPGIRKIFLCGIWNPGVRSIQPKFRPVRPGKVVHLKRCVFRNFSGWTEPVHRVLDPSFRKFWSNGSRPWALKSGILAAIIAIRNPEVPLTKNPESSSGNPDYHTGHGQSTVKTTSFILIQAFQKKNWRNYNHY